MADESVKPLAAPTALDAEPTTPGWIARRYANFPALVSPGQPLGLPENAVRGILGLLIVVGVMLLMWFPNAKGEHWAPTELLVALSAVTGFYFANPEPTAYPHMKAVLAIILVAGTMAFFFEYYSAPDALVAQMTTVIVLYFGQKRGGSAPPAGS